jgi:hypothetical protein
LSNRYKRLEEMASILSWLIQSNSYTYKTVVMSHYSRLYFLYRLPYVTYSTNSPGSFWHHNQRWRIPLSQESGWRSRGPWNRAISLFALMYVSPRLLQFVHNWFYER